MFADLSLTWRKEINTNPKATFCFMQEPEVLCYIVTKLAWSVNEYTKSDCLKMIDNGLF